MVFSEGVYRRELLQGCGKLLTDTPGGPSAGGDKGVPIGLNSNVCMIAAFDDGTCLDQSHAYGSTLSCSGK